MSTSKNEFNTKRSQSINLKNPFTLKSTMLIGTNDENKRSGSAHQRTSKSSLVSKDPLCNLNATSCSPLNEHVSIKVINTKTSRFQSHLSSVNKNRARQGFSLSFYDRSITLWTKYSSFLQLVSHYYDKIDK